MTMSPPRTRREMRERAAHAARAARSRRSRAARDIVIAVFGVVGAATVLWLVASWVLGLSLIVFATGSMSPTMPTGALAVTQRVDAAEMRVGDVVMVRRADGQFVTHRIIDIEPAADVDHRLLTMQGDANPDPDREIYDVAEGRRILFAVPGAGYAFDWLKQPLVTGSLLALLAAAVTWALWPVETPAAPTVESSRDAESA